MMKKLFYGIYLLSIVVVFLIILDKTGHCQTFSTLKVGPSVPIDSSALLEVQGTTGAVLIPRMTTSQKLANPATNGDIVYDTTLGAFSMYQAGSWVSIATTSALTFGSILGNLANNQLPLAEIWPSSGTVFSITPNQYGVVLSGTTSAGVVVSSGTTGYSFVSNGSGEPSWGILGVNGGGTGSILSPIQGGIIYSGSSTQLRSTSVCSSGQVWQSNGTNPPTCLTLSSQVATSPNTVQYTSGSGIYTPSANVKWEGIYFSGGGGGGGGSGSASGPGGAGASTIMGSGFINAVGGTGGLANGNDGAAGGACNVPTGAFSITGEHGTFGGGAGGGPTINAGFGGSSLYGAGGEGGFYLTGVGGTGGGFGAGGGGGGPNATTAGAAGGGGACSGWYVLTGVTTGYVYSVGTGGTTGIAGSGGQNGGAGSGGFLRIIEHFNY